MNITIQNNCRNLLLKQRQIAEIVTDAYWDQISRLCNDKAKMIEAMQSGYQAEYFYIAYDGSTALSVAACCPPKCRAVKIDPAHMCRVLGSGLGQTAAAVMQNEFGTPHDFGPDSGYIEFAATAKWAQGRGAASAVIKHIIETAPYKRLVLEAADTNQTAVRLYTKLGFTEFKRTADPDSTQTGINYRIYMEYIC